MEGTLVNIKTNAKKHAHTYKSNKPSTDGNVPAPQRHPLMILKASTLEEKRQLLYASFYAIRNELYLSDPSAINKFFSPKTEKRGRGVQVHRFASPISTSNSFMK